MNHSIEVHGGGIKCDNPYCDYIKHNVSFEDYSDWLNRPCPKCGENLLTEADYKNVQLLLKIAHILNKADSIISKLLPFKKSISKEKVSVISFKMNGTGKMDIDITESGNKQNN